MTKDEALKMAIEVIEAFGRGCDCDDYFMDIASTIDACKEALEQPSVAELNDEYLRDTYVQGLSQPAQEPVAIVYSMQDGYIGQMVVKDIPHKTKLYTHPAPLWQGLSEDEILEIDKSIDPKIIIGKGKTLFARAIEQALKEKNHD